MEWSDASIKTLCDQVVHEEFAFYPALGRAQGAHRYDGLLGPVGAGAIAARLADLDAITRQLEAAANSERPPELHADLTTARLRVAAETFDLRDLRMPQNDPRWGLDSAADVSSYVSRPYAPRTDRGRSLCAHLEQLPGWLEAAAAMLGQEVAGGPRLIAIDGARNYAHFYRDEVRDALGPIDDGDVTRRLAAAVEAAAAACDRYADQIENLAPREDVAIGGDHLVAMLKAREGITETVSGLRSRAAGELEALGAAAIELGARIAPGAGAEAAIAAMEADHPAAACLVDDVTATLERLHRFWQESDAVSIPAGARCEVRETPAFRRWSSASFEGPGTLSPPGLAHYFFITPVQSDWTAKQADEWLRAMNHAALENISVHEVLPGHFVHDLHGSRQSSLVRRSGWGQAFGEGWAHYAEHLAIECGLADGRPLLHLAQLQDALLRACRFAASLAVHAGGADIEEVTAIFMRHAYLKRFPAEREALRATYDPMYLTYTYGKLEILRWRAALGSRPGFELRGFHERMLGSGFPPLAVVRDLVLDGAGPELRRRSSAD